MQSVITLATPILDDPFVCRAAVLLVGEIAKGRAKLPTVDETDKYIPLDAVPHIAGIQGGGRSVVYSGGVEFLVAALHQNVASGELDTLYFSMSALIWVSGTDPNGMLDLMRRCKFDAIAAVSDVLRARGQHDYVTRYYGTMFLANVANPASVEGTREDQRAFIESGAKQTLVDLAAVIAAEKRSYIGAPPTVTGRCALMCLSSAYLWGARAGTLSIGPELLQIKTAILTLLVAFPDDVTSQLQFIRLLDGLADSADLPLEYWTHFLADEEWLAVVLEVVQTHGKQYYDRGLTVAKAWLEMSEKFKRRIAEHTRTGETGMGSSLRCVASNQSSNDLQLSFLRRS